MLYKPASIVNVWYITHRASPVAVLVFRNQGVQCSKALWAANSYYVSLSIYETFKRWNFINHHPSSVTVQTNFWFSSVLIDTMK